MSRTAIAIFGLVTVASINLLAPAVAHRISRSIGHADGDLGQRVGTAPREQQAADSKTWQQARGGTDRASSPGR